MFPELGRQYRPSFYNNSALVEWVTGSLKSCNDAMTETFYRYMKVHSRTQSCLPQTRSLDAAVRKCQDL